MSGGESGFVDMVAMQHTLFSELSGMFGEEVPMYNKSLLVNRICNRAVCDLLAAKWDGLEVTDEQVEQTSGERHGAIRIGRTDEYKWVSRFFAVFAMEPHNFYDMTSVGAKSQPVVATAFRSVVHPEHRVFTSLLVTDYFDAETKARIDARLAERSVFSDRAKALIEKFERDGGLSQEDAEALIAEATGRIFKWTGRAKDFGLYTDLCDAGFKIAAEIACFQTHHLNHLTPNTLWMDLYTAAMKRCMGERDAGWFRERASVVARRRVQYAGRDYLRLAFRHLTREEIDGFVERDVDQGVLDGVLDGLAARLGEQDVDLSVLDHNGFKDTTEGPSWDAPVLLRQDAYRALTEAVVFEEDGGREIEATHTARFGEIEQRGYAATVRGRSVYDACLSKAERLRSDDPEWPTRDHAGYERAHGEAFLALSKDLRGLVDAGLVFGRYEATALGLAQGGSFETVALAALLERGFVRVDGLRYEDFLPVSAAGIFASNLNQYGTRSTASERKVFSREAFEAIVGKCVLDTDKVYAAFESASILRTYADLGVLERVSVSERERLGRSAALLEEIGVADAGSGVARDSV